MITSARDLKILLEALIEEEPAPNDNLMQAAIKYRKLLRDEEE